MNTIPLSQPLPTTTAPTVSTTSVNLPTYTISQVSTASPNYPSNDVVALPNQNKLVQVHHQNEIQYVMEDYCKPISESFIDPQESCKFKKDCIVSKNKVLSKGTLSHSIPPTVFTYVPTTSQKIKYNTYDVRLMTCFNPSCKHPTTKKAKQFHHVCFLHMLNTDPTKDMKLIKMDSAHDKLVDLMEDKTDVSFLKELNATDISNLSLPFCGKRCYNTIINYRNKCSNKGDSEYATTQSWDTDGSSKHKTSIQVLIEWLTTEENCSTYYGGVDSNGLTSANRKETYHYYIRDLIRKENGKFIFT